MVVIVKIVLIACFQQTFWRLGMPSTITVHECRPPDFPRFGNYGPKKSSYLPGDVIHYFCENKYFMGGNYRRLCMDSGFWSGDTPMCDEPAVITNNNQSSTAQPESTHNASLATDGNIRTCFKTLGEEKGAEWTGKLRRLAREVIRFMLFLPKGPVSYEVFIVKKDGSEVSCGRNSRSIEVYDWVFHNCLQPNNMGAVAVKVKSLTKDPLEICEVVVHTLTDPTCADPHFNVANGRLRLTRKNAILVCDKGYTRHNDSAKKLDCIRTGVWSRRDLRCIALEMKPVPTQDTPPSEEPPFQPKYPMISDNPERETEIEKEIDHAEEVPAT